MEEKNPSLGRRIPAIGYMLLDRIVHIKKINSYISMAENMDPEEALSLALFFTGIKYAVSSCSGSDSLPVLPRSSRITVCSNHPFGGAEALVLLDFLVKIYGKVLVPANDILQLITPLSSFFVPVNKHGSNLESFRIFETLFKTDTPLIFFPAGRTGRPKGGGITDEKITDAPWSKTFFKKSRIHRRLIIPVFVKGRNSNFFYSAAWLRKKSGIRMILEMLLLADELFKKRDSVIEVTAGQPVDPADLDSSVSDAEWSDALRSYVHALGEGEKADFISWRRFQKSPL